MTIVKPPLDPDRAARAAEFSTTACWDLALFIFQKSKLSKAQGEKRRRTAGDATTDAHVHVWDASEIHASPV